MKIVIIGSGNVATHLGKGLQAKGYDIVQIVGRNVSSTHYLAQLLNTSFTTSLQEINRDADCYLFAVQDKYIEEVAKRIQGFSIRGLWLHTSGTTSLACLLKYHSHVGVLYPLQTFNKKRVVELSTIPFLLEVSPSGKEDLQKIAKSLSNETYWVDSLQRKRVHLAAVFACNFTNYCCTLAQDILTQEEGRMSFEVLAPLLLETIGKLRSMSPYDAQTGPARREDRITIEEHLKALQELPQAREVYKLLSKQILERYQV